MLVDKVVLKWNQYKRVRCEEENVPDDLKK